ncbi:hypothetical protein HMF7854_01795 [Sphingomonas ginkgonis]|uniref:Lipoprotein n=1 Tax=Sphingomonas ginkgonis TaxID=2315330 RepID=A0A429V6X4_9SPHN|nr:hypothetical protein [Sphingomonas ginkgonis]RST29698.1 hypothetical protein HMF7854_01795 [Sphingomonas ginkgonis]
MFSDPRRRSALVAGLLLATAGCTPVDPGLGDAVKYDQLVQTINPDPRYPAGGAQPGDSGAHGAKAVRDYRTGQVKQLEVQSTSSGSSSGGGPR